jgi:hypothetical protein
MTISSHEIERIVLEALVPDKLAIALATMNEVEREEAAVHKQWQLRLERARYEAERARRQCVPMKIGSTASN